MCYQVLGTRYEYKVLKESEIESISFVDDDDPVNYRGRVELRFNCNIYNQTTGAKKSLKNGEFSVCLKSYNSHYKNKTCKFLT